MTHARTEIRNAVVARLTGLPTTASRVYHGRTRPLEANHQPTLLIYTVNEQSGRPIEGNPASLGRTLLLVVEGRVSHASVPDDLLDVIASEVEAKLRNAEDALDVFDIMLQSTTIEVRADGNRHLGEINLVYVIRYSEPAETE
ncbi:hypothetical protein [Bradyrhizobium retamae]|uniref:DUF3168 domain-containing protein n=1 Tax=Bradyrhizobium retamae TaxID=1300035 RepID=A0A0R3MHX4_9BRAD|nr:hypothetical protein [Bradyrhizobium retamae]KRR16867.1 hypothetical protein CQ13_36535 [Bradyrhizobium retamae]